MFKAILAAAALVALSAPAEAKKTVVIAGSTDCGTWVESRTSATSAVPEFYVLGLLNGLAFGKQREFWHANGDKVSNASVYLWLDKYCRDHPLSNITTGAIALFRERVGD